MPSHRAKWGTVPWQRASTATLPARTSAAACRKRKRERKKEREMGIYHFQPLSHRSYLFHKMNALAVNDLGTGRFDLYSPCCHKHPFPHRTDLCNPLLNTGELLIIFCSLFCIAYLLLLSLRRTHRLPQSVVKYLLSMSRLCQVWLHVFSLRCLTCSFSCPAALPGMVTMALNKRPAIAV